MKRLEENPFDVEANKKAEEYINRWNVSENWSHAE